jgi:hypothetical protein
VIQNGRHILFRQRAVIEFLVKEEIPSADIHYRLQRVYGVVCVGAGSDRQWELGAWVLAVIDSGSGSCVRGCWQ